jgi:hypothetical protein
MKKPFVKIENELIAEFVKRKRVNELVAEIANLEEKREKDLKLINELVLCNPPAQYVVEECDREIEKLQRELEDVLDFDPNEFIVRIESVEKKTFSSS